MAKTKPGFAVNLRKPKDAGRFLACVFFCLLAGCGPRSAPTPFVAPSSRGLASPTVTLEILTATLTPSPEPAEVTPTVTNTPEPEVTATPEPPSPTPVCEASLRYLEDLTIPDGTLVTPGQVIEKQWRVENNGTCDWDASYRLKLVDGYPPLGATGEQALFPARAGNTAAITVGFTAPLEAGTYRTAWQAYRPDGTPFGEVVYMEITVGQ